MFSGTVVHGDAEGRKLGYPTANLDIDLEKLLLADGSYAVWAKLNEKKYKGALVVRKSECKVGVYLLDYNGSEFYGETLFVEPIQKVTDNWFVGNDEELKIKIKKDVSLIQQVFEGK